MAARITLFGGHLGNITAAADSSSEFPSTDGAGSVNGLVGVYAWPYPVSPGVNFGLLEPAFNAEYTPFDASFGAHCSPSQPYYVAERQPNYEYRRQISTVARPTSSQTHFSEASCSFAHPGSSSNVARTVSSFDGSPLVTPGTPFPPPSSNMMHLPPTSMHALPSSAYLSPTTRRDRFLMEYEGQTFSPLNLGNPTLPFYPALTLSTPSPASNTQGPTALAAPPLSLGPDTIGVLDSGQSLLGTTPETVRPDPPSELFQSSRAGSGSRDPNRYLAKINDPMDRNAKYTCRFSGCRGTRFERRDRALGHIHKHLNLKPFVCDGECGTPHWYVSLSPSYMHGPVICLVN
ncbi:hypothetical protein FRC17_002830 [Serendipita sp. 399]|nr:hypothetical protein FRC17_002830 [Serendipita sp. 399]